MTTKFMRVDKDEIVIGISKIKSFIMTFIAFGLLSIAVFAITKILKMPTGFDRTFLLAGISILTTVFGLSIISGIRKLLLNNQGLIINDKGININVGPNRGQFIEWDEIRGIKFHNQVRGNMFLLIFIENPTRILREAKGLNRFLLKMNNLSHKTPVSITSNWLTSNLTEIMEIITEKMNKNGAQHAV
ncbi:MAG: hypothetical protein IPM71_16265 [Bacteroidota bacterium]|nr:MAG: hypothetical protein IPM71_16265 [Bacteroidota bacterium]